LYSFDDAKAAERHTTQYFEMFGNRGIYHDGWVACTRHSIPWVMGAQPPLENDVWELYNVNEDFTEANDLAAKNPEKLKELQEVFNKEAVANHVFPIDDRRAERFDAKIAGRPDLMGPRTSLSVYEGMSVAENAFINIKNRTYTITADIEVGANANGVIIAQAGKFGGWTLYTKGGKLNHEYNYFGLEKTRITSSMAMKPGRHMVKYEFIAAEAKPGTGGKCTLFIDDQKVAEGQIPKTQPFLYSADEGIDVGLDAETNVSSDYKQMDNKFNGKIKKVTVDIKPSLLSVADKKLLEQKDVARRAAE